MSQPFETIREQLLKRGFAPRHVNRYVVELREHLADLTARERRSGMESREAEAKARTILGTDADLVQAMIDRGAPRSLTARAPWAVFGLLPLVAIIAMSMITAAVMMNVLWPLRAVAPADMPGSYRALIAAVVIVTGYLVGPLLAAGCIALALRQRLTSAWIWVGLALVAILSGFVGFRVPGADGGAYGVIRLVQHGGQIDGFATLGLAALRATVVFVLAALAYSTLKSRQKSSAV